jgi:hypothetical protein
MLLSNNVTRTFSFCSWLQQSKLWSNLAWLSFILQMLLHHTETIVMGTFYFVSVRGEPVLMSFNSSNASDLHTQLLFVQQHAPPGSCFYSWRFKPPPGVGVQHFWDHLKAKGAHQTCLLMVDGDNAVCNVAVMNVQWDVVLSSNAEQCCKQWVLACSVALCLHLVRSLFCQHQLFPLSPLAMPSLLPLLCYAFPIAAAMLQALRLSLAVASPRASSLCTTCGGLRRS